MQFLKAYTQRQKWNLCFILSLSYCYIIEPFVGYYLRQIIIFGNRQCHSSDTKIGTEFIDITLYNFLSEKGKKNDSMTYMTWLVTYLYLFLYLKNVTVYFWNSILAEIIHMSYSFIIKFEVGNVYDFYTYFCMSKMSLPLGIGL